MSLSACYNLTLYHVYNTSLLLAFLMKNNGGLCKQFFLFFTNQLVYYFKFSPITISQSCITLVKHLTLNMSLFCDKEYWFCYIESVPFLFLFLFQLTNVNVFCTYLSTIIPARITFATLLNLGLSSPFRFILFIDLVKVSANQSRTSVGTASGSTSLSSSSSSHNLLQWKNTTTKIR